MPILSPALKRARANKVVKGLIKNRLNESALAREKGVTPQAISKQVNKPEVQDKLQEFLDSPALDQLLLEVASQGLCADRPVGAAILISKNGGIEKAEEQGAIRMPDHSARHKFWHDCMIIKRKLKIDSSGENGKPPIINSISIRIGQIEKSQVKSDASAS